MKEYEHQDWRARMRIRLDYQNMLRPFVGDDGLCEEELLDYVRRNASIIDVMEAKREAMAWRALPFEGEDAVGGIKAAAEEIRSGFDDFVVLGIGGSALGPIAVHAALSHLKYNELPREKRAGPRLYVEDNIDPERMAALFDVIDPRRTAFNVITKSGSTSETMAQMLLICDMLKRAVGDAWAKHVVATTDERRGNLIRIAQENGLRTFFIPDGVGGRFSELSSVGLLPAAVCGIDIDALLAGARFADELCAQRDPLKNPAFMAAALETLAVQKGHNISVFMPYSDALKNMADWYAQLWAESLGKRTTRSGKLINAGQTPVKALGVTDQHSQVQLYTEGPFDKVVTFLAVEEYRNDVTIPQGFEHIPDVAFLGGHSFNELIRAEQYATEYALTRSGHINKTILMPAINPFTVGELLYMLEMQTAYAGELLDIDAFDQPGVEEGKNATYALLGKRGYEQKREEIGANCTKGGQYEI